MAQSYTGIIQVKIFGKEINLMANFKPKEGLLFVLDIHDIPPAQAFADLPPKDQKMLQDKFEEDMDKNGLEKELDNKFPDKKPAKGSSWKDKLKALFHHVHLKNVAMYWDTANKKVLFYLDVFIELEDALTSEDGNFALEFISFDLIFSSGNEAITDEDRNRKKEIAIAKKEFSGQSTLQKQVNKVSESFDKNHKELDQIVQHFTKSHKALEKVEQSFSENQNKQEKVLQQFDKNHKALDNAVKTFNQQQKELDKVQASVGKQQRQFQAMNDRMAKREQDLLAAEKAIQKLSMLDSEADKLEDKIKTKPIDEISEEDAEKIFEEL